MEPQAPRKLPDIFLKELQRMPLVFSKKFIRAMPHIAQEYQKAWEAVAADPQAIRRVHPGFLNDPELVKLALRQDGMLLEFIPPPLQNNREVVAVAVRQNRGALQFAAERLKSKRDPHFFLSLYSIFASSLSDIQLILDNINPSLRENKIFIYDLIKENGFFFSLASADLQDDEDIVRAAIERSGVGVLKDSSSCFKSQERFILWLIEKPIGFAPRNPLPYVSPILQDNEIVILAAIKQFGPEEFQWASDRLKNDPLFVLKLFKERLIDFCDISPSLQNHRAFAHDLVKFDGCLLECMSPALQDDEEIVISALESADKMRVIRHASERLKNSLDFILSHVIEKKTDSESHVTAILIEKWRLEKCTESLYTLVNAVFHVGHALRNNRQVVMLFVSRDGGDLKLASDALKDDEEVVMLAIKNNFDAIQWASPRLRQDENFRTAVLAQYSIEKYPELGLYLNVADLVRSLAPEAQEISKKYQQAWKAVEADPQAIRKVLPAFLYDPDLVMLAVSRDGMLLEWVPELLKNNKKIIEAAIKQTSEAFRFVPNKELWHEQDLLSFAQKYPGVWVYFRPGLENSTDFVCDLVSRQGMALAWASDELKDDETIVKSAVSNAGRALEHASAGLRNNRFVVDLAVSQDGLALEFASDALKDNEEVVMLAIRNNLEAIQWASPRLRQDENFRTAVLAQYPIEDFPELQSWLSVPGAIYRPFRR